MRIRLVAALVLVLALGACGGSSKNSGGAVSGTAITAHNFSFSPATLRVAAGATITVTDKDGSEHTVTSYDNLFDTGHIPASGGTKTFSAPSKAGTYKYHCNIHQYMHGTLIVG